MNTRLNKKTDFTSLHEAVLAGSPDHIDLLLKNGADRSVRDSSGSTAIVLAAKLKKWRCVQCFVDYPTDEMDTACYGVALYFAVQARQGSLAVELLTRANTPIHSIPTSRSGNTIVHDAVRKNLPYLIGLLKDRKANFELTNKEGMTPHYLAVDYDHWNCAIAIDYPLSEWHAPSYCEALIRGENPGHKAVDKTRDVPG